MTYDDGETPIPPDEAKRLAEAILNQPQAPDDAPLEDELPLVGGDDPDDEAE